MADSNKSGLTMQAWVASGYGGPEVLVLKDVPRPTPGDDEVLVQIRSTTVTAGDARLRSLNLPRGFGAIGRLMFGFTRPRQPVFGSEFSGIVEAAGRRVDSFKPGDAVVGSTEVSLGCHAQFRVVSATRAIVHKPASLSFHEAACLCFGGNTALHFLRKAKLAAGERMLVIGASGAVGSAMVQLAVHGGARVTGVASARNIELVRSLGAASVIDYTSEDYHAPGQSYDIIADTVGATSFGRCLPLLSEHGRFLAVAADLKGMFARPKGARRSIAGHACVRVEDLATLCGLAKSGRFKPVIDAVYDFSRLPEAHAYVDTRRKRGNVVVSVSA
jgi:NADPH:quinone reductase-like Zn-dependent oxidoreductase